MSEPSIPPGGRPLQTGGGLSTEAILTTHRILGAFGSDPRTFDILHADLFDSRQEVVLSALRALGGTKDERSFMYVARLFRHPDPEIVGAAVKAGGAIAPPDALPVFFKLATSTRVESVLLELLRAMARCCADAPEVRQLATALSRSVAAQAETRAAAIEILVRMEAGPGPMPGPAPVRGTLPGPQNRSGGDPGQGGKAVQGAVTVRGTGAVQGAAPGPGHRMGTRSSQRGQGRPGLPFPVGAQGRSPGQAVLEAFSMTHQELPLPLRASLVPIAAPLATGRPARSFSPPSRTPATRFDASATGTSVLSRPSFLTRTSCARACCRMSNPHRPWRRRRWRRSTLLMRPIGRRDSWSRCPPSTVTDRSRESFPGAASVPRHGHRHDQETGMRIASAKEYVEFHFDEPTKKDFLSPSRPGAAPRRDGTAHRS